MTIMCPRNRKLPGKGAFNAFLFFYISNTQAVSPSFAPSISARLSSNPLLPISANVAFLPSSTPGWSNAFIPSISAAYAVAVSKNCSRAPTANSSALSSVIVMLGLPAFLSECRVARSSADRSCPNVLPPRNDKSSIYSSAGGISGSSIKFSTSRNVTILSNGPSVYSCI